MSVDASLLNQSARSLVGLLKIQEISPLDLLDTLRWQVDRTELHVNALPVTCWDRAYASARALMDKPVGERGLLYGMPVPIKDLTPVAGVRTTYGSRVYANNVPTRSDVMVTRLESRGAIIYAKSNTPEFGAGGHTVNDVFGLTRNPWRLDRSAGGSSGGAAAALAARSAWLAQGSDLAGSLRTPAAFCGVVGLRPSPGRVGYGPLRNPFDTLPVAGPMARDVADTALLLDALTGASIVSPLAPDDRTTSYLDHALRPPKRLRVAFSPDLGIAPVEPEIAALCRAAMSKLAAAGIDVEEVELDLSGAHEAFHTQRGMIFAQNYGDTLAAHRELLNQNVVWNIEHGLSLNGAQILAANHARAALFARMQPLFDQYDAVVCPASIVPAFPATDSFVASAGGCTFDTYIDWLAITYALTLLSVPVLALPCAMTRDGLPVGLQIVGAPRGEAALLSAGATIERALGAWATAKPELEQRLAGMD